MASPETKLLYDVTKSLLYATKSFRQVLFGSKTPEDTGYASQVGIIDTAAQHIEASLGQLKAILDAEVQS